MTLIVALIVVLAAGAGASYLVFRQLESETVVIEATPEFVRAENGALCGQVEFILEPRKLGYWWLRVAEDATISGAIAIAGNESLDIGLRIYDPANRLVLIQDERQHVLLFELPADIRGDYRFEFDNRHSIFADKELTVSVCFT